MQPHLLQLTPLINHADDQVRLATACMIGLMHDQGIIQLSDAIEHFTTMLSDICKPIRELALAKIAGLLRSKLAYFVSCFTAR